MKDKKVYSILIIAMLIFGLAITAVPTMAGDFNSVYGDLYINDEIAPSGITVKLIFSENPEEITVDTDSNGHFDLGFTGHNWEEGYFSVKYEGDWYTPEGNPYVEIVPEEIGYPIDLNIEYSAPSPPPPPPPSPPSPPADTNNQPVADASAGEPYQGFVGEEITFDGSGSTDSDGTITNYTWDFGDNTTGYGVNPTHTYDTSGNYTIVLTVTDNEGATDTDESTVNILVPNIPPEKPTVTGTHGGNITTTYEFTFVSTDADNDSIQYTIDWGDGSDIETTDFVPNGTQVTLNHTWSTPGNYTIKVTAQDNETSSGTTEYLVSIEEEKEPTPEEEYDYTWLILLLILIIILLILLWLIKRKKPEEKKQPPKKTGNTSKKPSKKTGKK